MKNDRRERPARRIAVAALLALAPAVLANEGSPRYAVEGELRPLAVSADGRFAIEAQARFTPQAQSVDGRFALKAIKVPEGGCVAFPDPLFSNGFEAP